MARIDLRTRIRQRRDCAFQTLDGETVILLPRERTVHALNEVGSFLWERLARPKPVGALIRALCEEFDVDEATARADVVSFMREMVDRDLLQVHVPRPRKSTR